MRYNLLLVDCCRDESRLQKIDVITGDYLRPSILKGELYNQVFEIISTIEFDRPDKIIFDKSGIGILFYEAFIELVNNNDFEFTVNAFGLITYKGE